jgi:phospholipid/cholesterol/gamma-HCH transport system substrate-binding protein
MPRTRSLAWSELKIGLVSVFALVMAATLIVMLSGEGGFFWQRYRLKTVFDNVAGLKEGAPVRVAGVEVGSVTGIEFMGDRVEVLMELSKDMQSRITNGSEAALGSVSLLGEAAVDITASSEGEPLPEWSYVRSRPPAPSISDVTTRATQGLQEVAKLLQGVREGRGTIGRMFTDDALYREMNALVDSAEDVARRLSEGHGTIGRLANDPTAAKALEASMKNLEDVTARIRNGEGSVGHLLHDDTLGKSLTSTTANLETLTARLNKGEGTAGRLVNDPALYNRLNSTAERLDKVVGLLQQGQGTAGQLLHDRQLYENMNGAASELRQLVRDIRADPKKFLNVRVSVF